MVEIIAVIIIAHISGLRLSMFTFTSFIMIGIIVKILDFISNNLNTIVITKKISLVYQKKEEEKLYQMV